MRSAARRFESNRMIRIDGRQYFVTSELRFNGRRLLRIRELGNCRRKRTLVYDPAAKLLRLLVELPPCEASRHHIRVLRRLPQFGSLPRILDVEQRGHECHLLLQWIHGIDLGDYLSRVREQKVARPCPYEAIRIIRGLSHGLLQLHQYAQLIHADIKPENLLISRKPCHLSLIDFGSAWQIEAGYPGSPGDGLSPVYAAPEINEQVGRIDVRSDQFSVGVVLYELLTGQVPFDGLGGQAGKSSYAGEFAGGPETPSMLNPALQQLPRSIRSRIDSLVLQMLQFEPDKRFPTTSAVVSELDRLTHSIRYICDQTVHEQSLWTRLLDKLAEFLFSSDKPKTGRSDERE